MNKVLAATGTIAAMGVSACGGALATWIHEEKRLDISENNRKKCRFFIIFLSNG